MAKCYSALCKVDKKIINNQKIIKLLDHTKLWQQAVVFECPVQGCGKRVSVLYLAQIFACRKCCNFTYESQNEAPHYRMLSKAQKMHMDLGGDGYVDFPPFKPKRMHWKTYSRKVRIMEANARWANMEAMRKFEIDLE